MATTANRQPIYSHEGVLSFAVGSLGSQAGGTVDIAAMTAGAVYDCGFTADATNGGYVQKVILRPGAVSSGNVVATTVRLWANNGSATTTTGNNALIAEISVPAITMSITGATPGFEIPVYAAFPPGYKLYMTFGSANISAFFDAVTVAGKY